MHWEATTSYHSPCCLGCDSLLLVCYYFLLLLCTSLYLSQDCPTSAGFSAFLFPFFSPPTLDLPCCPSWPHKAASLPAGAAHRICPCPERLGMPPHLPTITCLGLHPCLSSYAATASCIFPYLSAVTTAGGDARAESLICLQEPALA